MLKVATWCAKCLFLYCLVAIAAIRLWPISMAYLWQLATSMHWTNLNRISYVLSYFLPMFAVAGFLLGLIPFGRLVEAVRNLRRSLSNSPSIEIVSDSDAVPPILWAWLPVTLAFLIRFVSWRSRTSSVFDAHRSTGRLERFFGPLYGQNPNLLDSKWITDRFLFTGPMVFLIACALAALLRYKLTAPRKSRQKPFNADSE
jgi:hypothetical protein